MYTRRQRHTHKGINTLVNILVQGFHEMAINNGNLTEWSITQGVIGRVNYPWIVRHKTLNALSVIQYGWQVQFCSLLAWGNRQPFPASLLVDARKETSFLGTTNNSAMKGCLFSQASSLLSNQLQRPKGINFSYENFNMHKTSMKKGQSCLIKKREKKWYHWIFLAAILQSVEIIINK